MSQTNRRVRIYRITRVGMKHLTDEVASFERMLAGIHFVLGLREA